MKKILNNSTFTKLATVLVLTAIATTCRAQQDSPKLPSADEVISKYVEVTGGLEKYKSLKTLEQKGTISIPAAGINGTINMKMASPDQISVAVSLPGAGEESGGSNGKTVWSDSTMTGTRIVTGKEAEQMKDEADFRRMYDPASVYESLKVLGTQEIKGENCYELEITKKNGDVQTEFYSVETGLQTKSVTVAHSPMGEMKIEATISEYREVDGLKMPSKVVQLLPTGMEMVLTFEELKVNPKFAADAFALPEKIQKMVEKQTETDKADDAGKPADEPAADESSDK